MENKQNSHEDLLSKFNTWANSNPNIRLAFIVGSRARQDCPADEWSDLDLAIVTNNPDEILISDDWLDHIGTPKISFIENTLCNGKERRILFDIGLDVDFIVFSCQRSKEILKDPEIIGIFNRGIRVLLDKDNITADLKTSDGYTPSHSLPTQEEFMNLTNDFWFHSVWTGKKLRRGELLQAKSACDIYMKNLLMQLIKWQTYCIKGLNYDTWHDCRFFERWVDQGILTKMHSVYAHYDEEDIWNALFSTMDLFRELGNKTASLLSYQYPIEADVFVTGYVNLLHRNR